ncbi:MAG: carboxypeptidase regulatory-like domain-containing protein [Candidatus Solibacter usitatus]|nr:carboxypeptidase regulatory-like domain-containing protein [Candidatus Solibacter usitatus]
MRRTMLLLLVLVLAALPVVSQVASGSLSGTVTDPNGALVPGAKIRAVHTPTGQEIETTSSDAGLFVFASLPPGPYTITVEKAGFRKLTQSGLEIRVVQRHVLDVQMQVGDVQQTVDVTAEAPLLETSTSDKGQSFSPKFMTNLPLFTGGIRNPRSFVFYMPGVNAGAEQSISGSGGRAQEVQIDGASLIIPESGGTVFNMPSAEMLSEFKLITGAYSPEFGRFGGGVEVYSTKSGTNWYHGTAFLNMRRDIWNANAWARNASTNPATSFRPKERQNEVGGAAGGPVYIPKVYNGKDKTFWYFTYTQRLLPANIGFPLSTVPTAAMKQGDFSALGAQLIYDPATTVGTTRTPFAGNRVPASRFSNVSKNLVGLIPDPTRAALQSNYDFVNLSVIQQKIWSIKADHAFSATNRLAFFLSMEDGGSKDTVNFAGPIGNGLGSSFQKPWNIRVNHDMSIRPNLFMHTTFGFSATRQGWDNPAQYGYASKLGIPGVPKEGDAMPRVMFTGQAGLSPYGVQDGKVANGGQDNDTRIISQGYSLIKGKHEIKFGWDYRFLTTFGFDFAGSNGRYYFNRLQTAVPNSTTGSGHEFASMLLGAVDAADNTVLPILLNGVRYRYTSGYINDNWRVGRKLTLNLGFRYEVPINWHIELGNYSGIDLTKPNIGAGNLPGALVFYGNGPGRTNQLRPFPTDYSDIGPRLGFAYQLFSKTVIRGGWGIYYQTLGNGGCGCRQGFANSNQLQSNGIDAVLNWDGGIPLRPGYQPPPLLDPTLSNFQSIDYFGPKFGKAPRVYNWSFNIQHEMKSWLFDVAYVGNRGSGLNSTISLNQLPTSQLSKGSLLTQTVTSPAAVAAGVKLPYAGYPNRSVAQSLRPFPQYLDVWSRNSGDGRTWYDSLQMKVEKRFGGLQLMAAYTFSKSLGNQHWRQIFSQNFNIGAQDAYNLDDMKSYNPFDQTHVFNLLWTYDLPVGRGKWLLKDTNHVVNALVGGWVLSGIQRYYSGNLIQLVTPGNPLANTLFSTTTKAMRNNAAIQTGFNRTDLDPNNPATRWFNAAAFSAAAPFTLGNAALYYGDFRQPPIAFENIGIVKNTTLFANEKNPVVLQYRADAFNLFNRSRFGGVNGTVGNANFGRPTGPQVGARAITMGLRMTF